MQEVIAPDRNLAGHRPRIFLAGSIEMGKAEDWQRRLVSELSDLEVTIFNPRRKDWDSSWEQKATNRKFKEQVDWELSRLDLADIIVYWFCPGTISPVTMLELGLHISGESPVVIGCPEGFHRKGNIDITANLYGLDVHDTWEKFVLDIRGQIDHYAKLAEVYNRKC